MFRNFLTVVTFESGNTQLIAVSKTRKEAEAAGEQYRNRDTHGIPKTIQSIDVHENNNPAITAPSYQV